MDRGFYSPCFLALSGGATSLCERTKTKAPNVASFACALRVALPLSLRSLSLRVIGYANRRERSERRQLLSLANDRSLCLFRAANRRENGSQRAQPKGLERRAAPLEPINVPCAKRSPPLGGNLWIEAFISGKERSERRQAGKCFAKLPSKGFAMRTPTGLASPKRKNESTRQSCQITQSKKSNSTKVISKSLPKTEILVKKHDLENVNLLKSFGSSEAAKRERSNPSIIERIGLAKPIQKTKQNYILEGFKRSNQDTCLMHKPLVAENTWIQSGDALTDCASSVGGELSLGQNLLIAYMPWEGYNFEDAILISERLVMDDLYTSVHIERYELQTQQTKLGSEEITINIPDVSEQELNQLDSFGLIKIGSYVEEGDILVGKTTPIHKKKISQYQKLLYAILEKQVRLVKDSSLRAPKGIKAKVIDIKYFLKSEKKSFVKDTKKILLNVESSHSVALTPVASLSRSEAVRPSLINETRGAQVKKVKKTTQGKTDMAKANDKQKHSSSQFKQNLKNKILLKYQKFYAKYVTLKSLFNQKYFKYYIISINNALSTSWWRFLQISLYLQSFSPFALRTPTTLFKGGRSQRESSERTNAAFCVVNRKATDSALVKKVLYKNTLNPFYRKKNNFTKFSQQRKELLKNVHTIHVYLAEKRKVQVGDKMAGRHGNKGIISQILPIQDMPFLPDGTPIDMVLNPLGVPSRMNVGQIYECLLGLAGSYLGENYKVSAFDEIYGPEASRSFVLNKLKEASLKTGKKWLFNKNYPGKIRLIDGRNGEFFDQQVTVGKAYMLRLVHMVDDKIHCLTPDHDVLTTEGWVPINKLSTNHSVATFNKVLGELEYQKPNKLFHYSNYQGFLYYISNKNVDLLTTLNHRMLVSKDSIQCKSFNNYNLIPANKVMGKSYSYLKTANWRKKPYQFIGAWLRQTGSAYPLPPLPPFASRRAGNGQAKGFGFDSVNANARAPLRVSLPVACPPLFGSLRERGKGSEGSGSVGSFAQRSPFNVKKRRAGRRNETASPLPVGVSLREEEKAKTTEKCQQNANTVTNNKFTKHYKQLWTYLKPLNKSLPSWVWELNQQQCQILLHSMCLGNGTWGNNSMNYFTNSTELADDLMRLALHAGWSGDKYVSNIQNLKGLRLLQEAKPVDEVKPPYPLPLALPSLPLPLSRSERGKGGKGLRVERSVQDGSKSHKTSSIDAQYKQYNMYTVFINKNQNSHFKKQNKQVEKILYYQGPVHCLSVNNEIFYVRRNGLSVWTGNSRSTGPYSLVTQQPLRGRSKQGGQRLGEMEVWALEGYGAAFTLLEMLTLKSDDMTGRMALWSNLILNKDVSIGTPESFKVLICELQALCLDIALFRHDTYAQTKATQKNSLKEIDNLINLP
jgi:hypothetical protein